MSDRARVVTLLLALLAFGMAGLVACLWIGGGG